MNEMKIEIDTDDPDDPIWTNNVELSPKESLPVIGSCQVTSILQNLDSSNNDSNLQNMDLIILQSNDYKMPVNTPLNLHTNNYIVLKDPIHSKGVSTDKNKLEPTDLSLNMTESSNSSNVSSISPKHYDRESFEDMLYFVCNLCPFLCTKETKITEHLETMHKNKTSSNLVQLKCPACVNIFYHKAPLKSHLLHDHCVENNDINLIVQAVVFYSNKENKRKEVKKCVSADAEVLNEVKVDEVKGGIKENGKKLDRDSDYDRPERAQQLPKIPLPQVDIGANNSEKLITDFLKKDPVVKYMANSHKCAYSSCKVLLTDPNKMDYHIESHSDEGFKCLECQEKFSQWKPLTSHLWRLHKVDMELYSCDKCDYKSNCISKLNTVHKLTHSNMKAFQCDLCQKYYKNKKQMRNHRRLHKKVSKEDEIACEICSKHFGDKRLLRSHVDGVHKKLKPFLCNYCGYKGSNRSSLKMHIRSHTGEKPFSCDQCEYSSSDHNSLRRHKLRHTGQKPYKCSYCSYACIQSSTYKVHLKTKHPGMEKDLMFACSLCQFRSVNRDKYNTHLVTAHKQSYPAE